MAPRRSPARRRSSSSKVNKVEETSLPPVDDGIRARFRRQPRAASKALRAEVRASMEREMAQAVRQRIRAAVIDALVQRQSAGSAARTDR